MTSPAVSYACKEINSQLSYEIRTWDVLLLPELLCLRLGDVEETFLSDIGRECELANADVVIPPGDVITSSGPFPGQRP